MRKKRAILQMAEQYRLVAENQNDIPGSAEFPNEAQQIDDQANDETINYKINEVKEQLKVNLSFLEPTFSDKAAEKDMHNQEHESTKIED